MNDRTQSASDPYERLNHHTDLPGTQRLLDAEALSDLVGHPVRPTRVRIKPGRSVVVAFQDADADGSAPLGAHGWAGVLAEQEKIHKAQARAERSGVELHRVTPVPEGTALPGTAGATTPAVLHGPVLADPLLGRQLAHALHRLHADASPRVLSYNPSRRIVLQPSDQVLRIAARSQAPLLQVTGAYAAAGLPTIVPRQFSTRPTATVSGHWGIGDLAGTIDGPAGAPAVSQVRAGALAAEQAGAALARLHTATPARGLPRAAAPDPLDTVAPLLRTVLPELTEQLDMLAAVLPERTGRAAVEGTAMIHGDLSPDQVLTDGDQVRIIDLDRAGTGTAELDLGTWTAACALMDTPHLAGAFLDGYGRYAPVPDLRAWQSRALLAAALEPLRTLDPEWPTQVAARIHAAVGVLDRGDAGPARPPGPAQSPGPAQTARPVQPPGSIGRGSGTAPDVSPTPDEPPDIPEDPRLPALAEVCRRHPGAGLISHRPGKRAVMHTPENTYVKIVRPGRTRKILDGDRRGAGFSRGFRVPRVLAHDDATVTFSAVGGRSLHEPAAFSASDWSRAWSQTMQGFSRAVFAPGGDVDAAGDTPPAAIHDAWAEIEVLRTWHGRALEVAPGLRELLDTQLQQLVPALTEGAGTAVLRPIHRDLHDKQLLWDPQLGPGLLDLDTVAYGEPALDLGNLRAHAALRELQGIWSPKNAATVRRAIDESARAARIDPRRLAVYEHAARTRLVCVYALRPAWSALVPRLLEEGDMDARPIPRPLPTGV